VSVTLARIAVICLAWCASVASAAALEGTFHGLDGAEGATLRLFPSGGGDQKGQYTSADGASGAFIGETLPDGVEATFAVGADTIYLRAVEHPSGAIVVLVPVAPDGTKRVDLTRSFGFLREGVKKPEERPYVIPEPDTAGDPVDAAAFVQSYEYWSPAGVGRGYIGVLPRYRSVIALFPALQTDIIWKLCSQQASVLPGLAEAMRGQGVSCPDVLGAVAKATSSGRYAAYRREVAEQRQVAFEQISCARRIGTRERCEEVARIVSEHAISMENAATVVAKYR